MPEKLLKRILIYSFALFICLPATAQTLDIGSIDTSEIENDIQSDAENRVLVYDGNAEQNFLEQSERMEQQRPATLNEIVGLQRDGSLIGDDDPTFDIRDEAIREGAVSYGARAGLAWRTFEIQNELQKSGRYLDKIYNFRQLLIPAPSGFLIEPPIVTASMNAVLIENDGMQAAVSDQIYNIVNNAKIVSTARTWRTYLEREWREAEPPPNILRPENDQERALWMKLVVKGWEEGVKQANEIFESDLNLLTRDFRGMIRYRSLLAQNMISPPYALQVDRGVTGGGNEMRIGDRAVQITGIPELITGHEQWQPANR